MKHLVQVDISNLPSIILELNDDTSPKTVRSFLDNLPFTVDLNVWGDEIYTSASPINIPEENAQSPVSLNDVAYWPTGKAICLFYGLTPISKNGEIVPASPVNIIGKIIDPNKSVLDTAEGKKATFRLKS
jgi:hypothetical protein